MGINKHENSGKAKLVISSGKKGQSLFHVFLIDVVKKEIKLISDNYDRHLSYLGKAKDDRLTAIVGLLAVEEALDSLLRAYIPKYGILDFTMVTKVNLARSLKLIPEHLLEAADAIRIIRNEFAHELHKDDFNSLTLKVKDRLIKIFTEMHPDDDVNSYSIFDIFYTTISSLLVCFGAYASNLKVAKEYIYSDDFFLKIKEIVKSNSKMK